MDEQLILEMRQNTLKITAMIASPMLIGALVVGLVISVLQAVTQINEATLTFIPKMVIVGLVFVIAAPWMMDLIGSFTTELFSNITYYVRN
jgi:flagellar biosynthetic protein FliQ